MSTLTLKISWGLALSDWANVCNHVKPLSTNVYQQIIETGLTIMGLHIFSIELLERGRTFSDFWGKN